MALDHLAGGVATARTPATGEEQELLRRTEIAAAAASYLTRTGNADILPILGLDRDPGSGIHRCANCGGCIANVRAHRRKYCSPSCASQRNAKERA